MSYFWKFQQHQSVFILVLEPGPQQAWYWPNSRRHVMPCGVKRVNPHVTCHQLAVPDPLLKNECCYLNNKYLLSMFHSVPKVFALENMVVDICLLKWLTWIRDFSFVPRNGLLCCIFLIYECCLKWSPGVRLGVGGAIWWWGWKLHANVVATRGVVEITICMLDLRHTILIKSFVSGSVCWVSGKLWYLQHSCVGDTIAYH